MEIRTPPFAAGSSVARRDVSVAHSSGSTHLQSFTPNAQCTVAPEASVHRQDMMRSSAMHAQASITLPRRTIALLFGVTAALSLAGAAAALPRSSAAQVFGPQSTQAAEE